MAPREISQGKPSSRLALWHQGHLEMPSRIENTFSAWEVGLTLTPPTLEHPLYFPSASPRRGRRNYLIYSTFLHVIIYNSQPPEVAGEGRRQGQQITPADPRRCVLGRRTWLFKGNHDYSIKRLSHEQPPRPPNSRDTPSPRITFPRQMSYSAVLEPFMPPSAKMVIFSSLLINLQFRKRPGAAGRQRPVRRRPLVLTRNREARLG